ncbi:hypothetical protein ABIC37_006034 [Priestia megaterium]
MIPLVVANDKTLMLGSIKSKKGSSIEDPFLIPIKCFMLTKSEHICASVENIVFKRMNTMF